MKKILALILVLALALAVIGCTNNEVVTEEDVLSENVEGNIEEEKEEVKDEKEDEAEDKKEETESLKETEEEKSKDKPKEEPSVKPEEEKNESVPEVKPEEEKNESVPEVKPEEEKPESVPEVKPEEKELSMGATLKKEFISLTSGGQKDILAIANKLIENPVIQFMPGVMEVEPGFLNGFDADEITGFEKGVAFLPMIGSIPFIGYIFELADGSDADAFIATLRENANLRWNICVSADEILTAKSGNLVFFLMSPLSMEEEPKEE